MKNNSFGFKKGSYGDGDSVIGGLIDRLKKKREAEAADVPAVPKAAEHIPAREDTPVTAVPETPVADAGTAGESITEEVCTTAELPDEWEYPEDSATEWDLPLDWDSLSAPATPAADTHTESVSDALVMSLSNLGRVDIEYISQITGQDMKTVISALKGSIYQNPDTWEECYYKGWETADEYLSGNIMRKWKAARKAEQNYQGGIFKDNVEALRRVLPAPVSCDDIYITLGSPLLTVDMIDRFITHILGLDYNFWGTTHDEVTGTWEIPHKASFHYNVRSFNTYGTVKMEALYILEKTLNMKTVAVYDERLSLSSSTGKRRVLNKPETVLALERQTKMIEEFQSWIWKDPARREELEMIFENNFGCRRQRHYDGSFLSFPTMSPDVHLHPYQKNAVARILFSPNTLLAHDVGSGKTFIMIAAGMELKRMGLSRKNLYVVPNNIVGQWKSIFMTMYPSANILCVEPKSFTPKKRTETLRRMRDEDFDGIIIAYSCFEHITVSPEAEMARIEDEIAIIDRTMAEDRMKRTKKLKKRREKLSKEHAKLVQKITATIPAAGEPPVTFDSLGVTRLFIDEAHNFKNVPIETKIDRVLGISGGGSNKCREMMEKVHYVQKHNNGGGVVMATGTPITNSVTDVFVMQKYLQSGELALLDISSFDAWIGMFAERTSEFEIDVDTNSYRLATRFAKFHNLPELTAMLSGIADFHQVDPSAGIPENVEYKEILISKTPEFAEYLKDISHRADACRSGAVSRTEDNMLKITVDGRLAALDIRLVMPDVPFSYCSKVARCAENVFQVYMETYDKKSTQLIFCDSSTPKSGFNIYDELKRLLTSMGIPEDQVAYIHDATTETKREALFTKVRRGEIRILIGSTFKLGLGVNVQNKLYAIHHLDVPWRPADMTQREGRILRQGNENRSVKIFRYVTEGSFDSYSWQLLETKQRFIVSLLSGSITNRSESDIENTVLDYAEVKALAVGNLLVKKRVEVANAFNRCLALQRKAMENRLNLQRELSELPSQISYQEGLISRCRDDIISYRTSCREHSKEERRQIRERIFAAVADNVLKKVETPLMEYQGFTVVLPANMIPEKPFVWLKKSGRYYVELGESDKGTIIRIDNFLDGLDRHLEKLTGNLEMLNTRKRDIEAELSVEENYTDELEEYRRRLREIDEKLGVTA